MDFSVEEELERDVQLLENEVTSAKEIIDEDDIDAKKRILPPLPKEMSLSAKLGLRYIKR
jgi:hypothetical protein